MVAMLNSKQNEKKRGFGLFFIGINYRLKINEKTQKNRIKVLSLKR